MELSVYAKDFKTRAGVIDVNDILFDTEYNESLVHQLVTTCMTNVRQGTKSQKTRSMVRGGGKKPWRQKGTGRARAGTIRSPLWRGGGVTFAASPKKYNNKLNKKMYLGGMRSIFSELLRQNRLMVAEEFSIDKPKTKQAVSLLQPLANYRRILLLTDDLEEDFYLAVRNLSKVSVVDVDGLNPVVLVKADMVVATKAAMLKVGELLS